MSGIVGRADVVEDLPRPGEGALRARLAGVALTSPDAAALGVFYEELMDFAGGVSNGAWQGALEGRWLSASAGTGNAVDYMAFELADAQELERLKVRLEAASVPYQRAQETPFFDAALRLSDPDGNEIRFGIPAATGPENRRAPGGARLQHIVFATDQTERMVLFYCDVIGFTPSDYVRDDAGDLTAAFLRCSEEHHSLAVFRAPTKRLDHLCYDVADWRYIRDWADRFAARHVPLRWGPGRHGPGNNLFFFVNDPDGNWLEFSCELERVEVDRPVKLWPHEERTLNSWGAAKMRS